MSKEIECAGWAAKDGSGVLAPFKFPRRALRSTDVKFKITHCGICHTDLHLLHNEWGSSKYPMVPGHELVGIVAELGPGAKKFKVGDHVGVGCMVFSCLKCDHCKHGDEQYCDQLIWTYNSLEDGKITFGGYSGFMVADEKFVVRVPDNLPLDAAAPLLCAGITVYSPMKHFGMTQAGKNFGVVGLGGLGHMAVKFGKAFGMKVTVISTSPSKEKEAREVLGAHNFIVSKDAAQMKKAAKTMDYILDTVSAPHPLDQLLELLKIDGKLVMVGLPDKPLELPAGVIIFGRRTLAGSFIGSIRETQDMLDFCGKNNVTSMVEVVPMDYVNKAMERLRKSDVKYRFVLDVEKTQNNNKSNHRFLYTTKTHRTIKNQKNKKSVSNRGKNKRDSVKRGKKKGGVSHFSQNRPFHGEYPPSGLFLASFEKFARGRSNIPFLGLTY